ncbi:MAG: RelA/SpoT family protein [Bacteroidetes bacterium]|nr:MAG: RelA/SpoT family protein [Bacteroidota bacterium]
MYQFSEEEEKKLILNKYRQILRHSGITDPVRKAKIRKAFNFAVEAHKGMRRKSGEPYVLHPLEVALISTRDIGLKTTSIICALMHDVVEDTDYTLKDIELMFGKKVAKIIDGLTKISEIFDKSTSLQAENFRKILLTLTEDVRVILIKLADRLHNMRTLESMPHEKQMKIASETEILYAPMAHRLGLFTIKSELEDLILKHKQPDAYHAIAEKLTDSEYQRKKFITRFIQPIKRELKKQNLNYNIAYRDKAISSIWSKMKKKHVSFEEVYDLFAVRIIVDSSFENENSDCWRTYSSITSIYVPKHDRFRDWISVPKANGYEALHTTVMSREGKWVEVQIRSKRMDEVAEKGYAAHWKYKDSVKTSERGLDEWLNKIRELLQNPNSDALDFLDDFKLNFFASEIYAFTPRGEMITMPKGATILDFAFSIHSEIGNQAIGAKVNGSLCPLSQKLNSGDQVEILTSSKQTPKDDWKDMVVTARAKSQIKASLKEVKKQFVGVGKVKLAQYFSDLKKERDDELVKNFQSYLDISSTNNFYYRIAKELITEKDLKNFIDQKEGEKGGWLSYLNPFSRFSKTNETNSLATTIQQQLEKKPESLILTKDIESTEHEVANCCQALPGDDVIGFIQVDGKIKIHRTTCPKASNLMATYGKNIVKAKWREEGNLQFLSGITFVGHDKFGLIREIIELLTSQMGINIRSFEVESHDEMFKGKAMLYVQNSKQLDDVIKKLKKIDTIKMATRL